MNDINEHQKSHTAHDHNSAHAASIPGDPFPWQPDPAVFGLEPGETAQGATPSPAEPGDPSSFDLGGGD